MVIFCESGNEPSVYEFLDSPPVCCSCSAVPALSLAINQTVYQDATVLPSAHRACNCSSPQGLQYCCGFGRLRTDRCMLCKGIWRSYRDLAKDMSSLTLRCVITQIIFDISGSSSVSSWIASPWRLWQYYSSKGRELFTNRHGITHSRYSNIQQLRNNNLTKPRKLSVYFWKTGHDGFLRNTYSP